MEAVAAVLVMSIWAAVLLGVLAIGLTFYNERVELGMVSPTEPPTARAVALEWPTDAPTATPAALATEPAEVQPEQTATVTPPVPTEEAIVASDTPAVIDTATVEPAATATVTATPRPRATATDVPTPEPTSTVPPTPTATRVIKVVSSPSPEPTSTPIPTITPTATKPPPDSGEGMLVNQGQADQAEVQAQVLSASIGDGARPTPGPPSGFIADTGPLAAAPPPAGDPPTRIVIPKIGLDSKIIPVGWHVVQESGHSVSVWDVADFAAGWNRGSSFPGNVGNTVISGHHNIKGEVFRYVVNLEVGDEVDLFVAAQRYPYLVSEKHILREKGMPDAVRTANAQWIAQTTDQRLTLVTCWPYANNTHRLIVVAKPMWK